MQTAKSLLSEIVSRMGGWTKRKVGVTLLPSRGNGYDVFFWQASSAQTSSSVCWWIAGPQRSRLFQVQLSQASAIPEIPIFR